MLRSLILTVLTLFSTVSMASLRMQCEDLFLAENEIAWRKADVKDHETWSESVKVGRYKSHAEKTRGLEMAFEVRQNKDLVHPEATAILLHGVGDDRRGLEPLAKEFEQQNWRVISFDLLGHGDTAELNQKRVNELVSIDYRDQIQMVTDIALKLGLKDVVIIGHSMGGGLSMNLSAELKERGVNVQANVPIAPYLSPIDKFLLNQVVTPEVATFVAKQVADKVTLGALARSVDTIKSVAPMTGGFIFSAAEAYVKIVHSALWPVINTKLNIAENPMLVGLGRGMRFAAHYQIRQKVESLFTKYENLKNEKRPKEDRYSAAQIELMVRGAASATLGIQDLDFQARRNPSRRDSEIPTLIFYGHDDQVVIKPQIEDFRRVVEERGDDVTFQEIDSDHFLPQRYPLEIARSVIDFMRERNLFARPGPSSRQSRKQTAAAPKKKVSESKPSPGH